METICDLCPCFDSEYETCIFGYDNEEAFQVEITEDHVHYECKKCELEKIVFKDKVFIPVRK